VFHSASICINLVLPGVHHAQECLRFYPDRADDCGCDYRYSGCGGDSCLPAIHDAGPCYRGFGGGASAKAAVTENAASGAATLDMGWTPPTGSVNVFSIAINPANGRILITYTAIAGSGTIEMEPTSAGNPLVAGTPPVAAVAWTCTGGNSGPGIAACLLPLIVASTVLPSFT
jgi:hypothetical protein